MKHIAAAYLLLLGTTAIGADTNPHVPYHVPTGCSVFDSQCWTSRLYDPVVIDLKDRRDMLRADDTLGDAS